MEPERPGQDQSDRPLRKTKVYYVGARLSKEDSRLLGSFHKQLHATIIYSRKWFPYEYPHQALFPLEIKPEFWIEKLGALTVLRFDTLTLSERHKEFLRRGATWDYPNYKAHITLPNTLATIPTRPLTLEYEYYGTWKE